MDLKEQTIETYNKSADKLAEKFNNQGARIEDINYVFSMQDKQNPFVLEIGCGNGRDALEICKRTNRYKGIDISENLLALARTTVSNADFEIADIETYVFPKDIDIVFAFASLIHVPKESFRKILENLYSSMADRSLVFISLKHATEYTQVTKEDEFGVRTYWHYSQNDIHNMISDKYSIEHTTIHDLRGQVWMDVLLRRI